MLAETFSNGNPRFAASWRLVLLPAKAAEHCRSPKPASLMPASILFSQGFFQPHFRFGRKLCVRYFADFFRELARDSAHIFELFHVAFAKGAHEKMDTQFDPRD
jgi:hypothetical protein